jgi:hypothetical protein
MAHRLASQARAELSNIWTYIARESGSFAAADGVVDAITARLFACAVSPYGASPGRFAARIAKLSGRPIRHHLYDR